MKSLAILIFGCFEIDEKLYVKLAQSVAGLFIPNIRTYFYDYQTLEQVDSLRLRLNLFH